MATKGGGYACGGYACGGLNYTFSSGQSFSDGKYQSLTAKVWNSGTIFIPA